MPHISSWRGQPRLTSAIALAAIALVSMLAACRADAPTGADPDVQPVPISISAVLTPGQQAVIAGMSVEVTGPSITVPIVAELEVSGAAVSGSVTVPAGGQRLFTVRAYDATGLEIYSGSATVAVRPGSNPPLAITLFGRTGDVPIEVTIGTLLIAFETDTAALLVGGSTTVVAYVIDVDRLVRTGTVHWAALNPVIAGATPSDTSDRVAEIAGRVEGATTLVATYNGVAAAITIAVVPGPSANGFVDVRAGNFFSCAIDAAKRAWCWGENAYGQLGDGTLEAMRPTLSPVYGSHEFSQLATGGFHACGLDAQGILQCWGRAQFGELGVPFPTPVLHRTPQEALSGDDILAVVARNSVTCFLSHLSYMYCNGYGVRGEIGLVGEGTPEIVETHHLSGGDTRFTAVSISQYAACALDLGQHAVCATVADGRITTASAVGYAWSALEVGSDLGAGPIPSLSGAHPWACGITTSGDMRCWGSGERGQLGAGTGADIIDSPNPVHGTQFWDAVTVGGEFACGLKGTTALCWGRNDAGQLGDGTFADRWEPTPVAGSHAFTRLSAGTAHACGLRTDGVVMCWGLNQRGELGDGTTMVRNTPVAILLPSQP